MKKPKILLQLTLLLILFPPNFASRISGLIVSAPEEYENLKLTRTFGTDSLSWLHGHLYRVGPGILNHGTRTVKNVLDGLAKVHGWKFNGGEEVRYTAKMVKSKVYNRTMTEGKITAFAMMAEPEPLFDFWEHMALAMGGQEHSDNTNIAVWDLDMGQSLTLTTESFNMHQVVPDSLNYKRPYKLPGTDDISLFSAAHFSKHPVDGTSFNFVAKMKLGFLGFLGPPEARYDFFQYTPLANGKISKRKVSSIPTPLDDIRIIHQFAITENYLVVPRWNYKFNFVMDLSMFHKMAYMCGAFTFEYNKPTYVDIININSGHKVQFQLPIQKAVHEINSFERINSYGHLEIVMDYPCLTDAQSLNLNDHCLFDIYDINILENPDYLYQNIPWDTTIRRFVFNMNTNQYRIEDFPQSWRPKDSHIEFPFINRNYNGKQYCFAYFQQWHFRTEDMDLMKYDMCTKKATTWHEDNKHVLEPVFVPHPEGKEEDDGVIVAQVYDSKSGKSEVCVWDAKDLQLVARYDNKVKVPYTVHGAWFDE